jgi:YggT family protein
MSLLLALVAMLLLLFQILLIGRAVLDWSAVLAGPSQPGSLRNRLSGGARRLTEPVLAPVRRVLPPLRLGSVAIDLSFIAVFIATVVLRQIVLSL